MSSSLSVLSFLFAIMSACLVRTEVAVHSKGIHPFNPTIGRVGLVDFYSDCGVSKGCIAEPYECIDSQDCDMMATYKKIDDQTLELEIYGKVGGNEYIAVGFSIDEKMGVDSVVECVHFGDSANAYQSYNMPGDKNQRMAVNTPGFVVMSDVMYKDGYVYCRVQHPIQFSNNQGNFDLNTPYHLLMATGPADSDKIREHNEEKASSALTIPANDTSIVYFDPPSRVLRQLHGSFMVVAWLMAASIGVLMPRYMKKTWVGKQIMKKDRWFIFHQGLMGLAWVLTVAAFIIIFIDVGGWVSEPVSEMPHALIGTITTVLAFIQPFMAALRPAPDAKNRYIFNWAHMGVGYSAHILALTCIFLAVEMEEAELRYETYWILTTHVCVYAAAHVALTVLSMRKPSVRDALKDDIIKDDKGSLIRQILILAYVCIVVGLGTTVIVFIAVEK